MRITGLIAVAMLLAVVLTGCAQKAAPEAPSTTTQPAGQQEVTTQEITGTLGEVDSTLLEGTSEVEIGEMI